MHDNSKKLFVITYGCQMNEADSGEMSLVLAQSGYRITVDMNEADAVLLNTCTVREHAEHRAISNIGRLKHWKNARPDRKIIVAGCAAQRLGNKLKKRFPHVDVVAGAKDIDRFAELVTGLAENGCACTPEPQAAPLVSYVTIMRGCSHACAYCIVPSVRGPGISRNADEILAEVRAKVSHGAREIVLLGQTVNSYGVDGGGIKFPELLRRVHEVEGVARIRFMSPHPSYINQDFAETLARCPKIARHMHLPVQSGSDRILTLMKRGYTRAGLLEKISLLKNHVPDIAVSTDFIVGFPTEQESDFAETLSLIEECGFTFAYCFKYSPRQGTVSAIMEGQPASEELESRLSRLLEQVRKTSALRLEQKKGTLTEILFETPTKGRTSDNYWVRTQTAHQPGTLVKTEITGLKDNTLTTNL